MEYKTKGEKRRAFVEGMFKRQNGKCHWCGRQMTLKNRGERLPPNYATREHLYDRFNKERENWEIHAKLGVPRIVLACLKCNHERGAKSVHANIEEHKKRSKNLRRPSKPGPERCFCYSTEEDSFL